MSGERVAVITGASTGIGAAATRALHRRGWRVVITGRDPERTAAVAAELAAPAVLVDYTKLKDVRRAAEELLELCPRIDVLANNAGGIWAEYALTEDGYERTLQVNHLAPALLTQLLLPRLRHTDAARIVFTSSGVVRRARLDLHDGFPLHDPSSRHRVRRAYPAAKLANLTWAQELARREQGLLVTTYQPGVVNTDLSRNDPIMGRATRGPLGRLMLTPEQGADTLVWLATTAPSELQTGGHYAKRRPARGAKRQPESGRLWAMTEAAVNA